MPYQKKKKNKKICNKSKGILAKITGTPCDRQFGESLSWQRDHAVGLFFCVKGT